MAREFTERLLSKSVKGDHVCPLSVDLQTPPETAAAYMVAGCVG